MSNWQDRLNRISKQAASEREVLENIEMTAVMLGFDFGGNRMASSASRLWKQARSMGLCCCLSPDDHGALTRGGQLPTDQTPAASPDGKRVRREIRMRWLAFVAHLALDRQGIAYRTPASQSPLTERELEVLKWTAQGKTTSEIAALLRVSGNTVNFHIRNVITKLDARNKTAAAVRAATQGWLGG